MIFDNTKVRRLVPDYVAVVGFHQGAAEIVDWYDADPSRQVVDTALDATMDQLVATIGYRGRLTRTEPRRDRNQTSVWSRVRESNPRPHDYKSRPERPADVASCCFVPCDQVFRVLVV